MTESPAVAPSLLVLAAGMARRYGGCKPLAPIGPHGEAVLDLLVADAVRAGFGRIVLVLHPETGPAIRYHVEQCWPAGVEVAFATQRLPLGTVTRGICTVGDNGLLISLDERRQLHTDPAGGFVSDDGLEPRELSGDLPASVNLWGFRSDIWKVFHTSMDASGLDEEALLAQVAAGGEVPKAEVLLPEVVSTMVADGGGLPVRVLTTDAKLVGVTHAADLPIVSAELSRQVAWGVRPANLWAGVA